MRGADVSDARGAAPYVVVVAHLREHPQHTGAVDLADAERLGSMLSLSRQTVNALLQGLEREQLLVCVRGGVRIVDFQRLLELEASIQ